MSDDEFTQFYLRSAGRLTGQLYLMTGDVEEARDCVQEAFARAWVQWERLRRAGDDPSAWVRKVAWRIAVSRFRRRQAHARAVRRHGLPADVAEPSAEVIAVRDALARLPQGQRSALVLHYYEGLSVDEIAAVLGLSSGGVKSRLFRGRAAMVPLLADVPSPPRPVTPLSNTPDLHRSL